MADAELFTLDIPPAGQGPAAGQRTEEQIASWFWPGERFRRGHRLFEADRVAITIDLVTISARQIVDGAFLPAVELTFQPTEILRRILP